MMKRFNTCAWMVALGFSAMMAWPLPGANAGERCEKWAAKAVSVEGAVHFRRAGAVQWMPVAPNDTFCAGDRVRVQERSRAAILLPNETLLRLDQKTTITFAGEDQEKSSLLELIRGAIYFFSRVPRALKLATPFVNGTVEGTEFLVRVDPNQTLISVFEGTVQTSNSFGSLRIGAGQSALARAGEPPLPSVWVRSQDAVSWALYYPPILSLHPDDFPGGNETDWQEMIRRSIGRYRAGDLNGAFSSLVNAPEGISDPRFFSYRAGLLLSVGRLEEANADIQMALRLDASNSRAVALQSMIALAQNEKDRSVALSEKAIAMDPKDSAARVAHSYARQGVFDLNGALSSLREAADLDPENALVFARLAEVWLCLGDLDRALSAAGKAVELNPELARTQTVLGFAYLTQIKTEEAKDTFEKAIQSDQSDPLPRLGLGLAKIRDGDLKGGRGDIEIAAGLDPTNSLIRSYLGKAYFEEKRAKRDGQQYRIAKALDPSDPTPWFYDAIRKQTLNRPVEALQDLEKSIELNDNRAVYRSRLLLDGDLAARSASLGRIYSDLGFQQRALVEGWKSVNVDPSNFSAHRFLADSYAVLPRHEIARVSELLQSQLLQPINIAPVQPQLAESDMLTVEGAAPKNPGFNEYTPLFLRNRFALQASGISGENGTLGTEVAQSGVWNKLSYSVGGFQYETDGFRENNDIDQELYNLFIQASISHKTSLQAEFRYKELERGDLALRFQPDNFSENLRQKEKIGTARFGFHHAFAPGSDLIGSAIYGNKDADTDEFVSTSVALPAPFPPIVVPATVDVDMGVEETGHQGEIQHLYRGEVFNLISGAGYYDADRKFTSDNTTVLSLPFPPFSLPIEGKSPPPKDVRHSNVYMYSSLHLPETVTWSLGLSADFLRGAIVDEEQVNPKLGLTWNLFPGTTFRAAAFRTMKRTMISNQTLEPTHVAGFNQFFDDTEGVDTWRYGAALDQKFSHGLFGGVEWSTRKMQVPYLAGVQLQPREVDWEEQFGRAYLYWTPHPWLAASAEYRHEQLDREREFPGKELFTTLKTHKVPLAVRFFHPSGLFAQIKDTYVQQEGVFFDQGLTIETKDSDAFWVMDAFFGYRLPNRWGTVTAGVLNLLDENFKFQDTNPANPSIAPSRYFFVKMAVVF